MNAQSSKGFKQNQNQTQSSNDYKRVKENQGAASQKSGSKGTPSLEYTAVGNNAQGNSYHRIGSTGNRHRDENNHQTQKTEKDRGLNIDYKKPTNSHQGIVHSPKACVTYRGGNIS